MEPGRRQEPIQRGREPRTHRGPQTVHRRKDTVVVVVAAEEYKRLTGKLPRSRTILPGANRSRGSTSTVIRGRAGTSAMKTLTRHLRPFRAPQT